jgi:hypothetical protein
MLKVRNFLKGSMKTILKHLKRLRKMMMGQGMNL